MKKTCLFCSVLIVLIQLAICYKIIEPDYDIARIVGIKPGQENPFSARPGEQLVSFPGTYNANFKPKQDLIVEMKDQSLRLINGCCDAENTIFYAADTSGYAKFTEWQSIHVGCDENHDAYYGGRLARVVSFIEIENQIIFNDKNNETVVVFTLVEEGKPIPSPPPVVPEFFNGVYSTNVKNNAQVRLDFTASGIKIFGGCNKFTAKYNAFSNRRLSIKMQNLTNSTCLVDYDREYFWRLQRTQYFEPNKNGQIELLDQSGSILIVLTPDHSWAKQFYSPIPGALPVSLKGKYMTNLKQKPEIVIEINDENYVIKNGCHQVGARYSADSSGSVKFGPWYTFEESCDSNFDDFYVGTLRKAVSYLKTQSQVLLKDENGNIVAVLTLIKESNPALVQIKPTSESLFGIYSTNIEGNKDVRITFYEDSFRVTGACNIIYGAYNALSNGSVKISQKKLMDRYCIVDEDIKYQNAFQKIKYFSKRKDKSIQFMDFWAKSVLILSLDENATAKLADQLKQYRIYGGCNVIGGKYVAKADGFVEFAEGITTLVGCRSYPEMQYAQVLQKATSYRKIDGSQIELKDKNGTNIAILTKIQFSLTQLGYPPVTPVMLPSGTYPTQFKNESSSVQVQIDQNTIKITGECNHFSGSISAFSDFTISIQLNQERSNICTNGQDEMYIKALKNANYYMPSNYYKIKDQGKQIRIIDDDDQFILYLNKIEQA